MGKDIQIVFKPNVPPEIINRHIWNMAGVYDSYQLPDGSVVLVANPIDIKVIDSLAHSSYIQRVEEVKHINDENKVD